MKLRDVKRKHIIEKNFNKIFIFIVIGLLFLTGCSSDSGKVAVEKYRIISLSPHITEIIYKLGAEKDLVAITDFCRFPEEVKNVPKIGGLLNPNIEKIVSLKPTHIFGVPAHSELAASLNQYRIEIIMMPNETVKDFLSTVEKIGSIMGLESTARAFNHDFMDSLSILYYSPQDDPVSAVLVIGREDESLRNITVAGIHTFISELWERVGGSNVYHDLPTHYASITIESLLIRNPDVIIELSSEDPAEVSQLNSRTVWHNLDNIRAVKMNHIYKISGSHTLIPGPRMLRLARDLRRIIRQVNDEKRIYSNLYR